MERIELARLLPAAPPAGAGPAPVLVEDRDPGRFMCAFSAAARGSGPVFLGDPSWGSAERLVVNKLVQAAGTDPNAPPAGRGWLLIPSGGTGGSAKFARHDQDTLWAAALGFGGHFRVERINSVGVLPLHHVSGLMAWMRALATGGTYLPWDWRDLEAGRRPAVPAGTWFLSLVPTQLHRLLASSSSVEWMRGFHAVIVGGGPVWPGLAAAAAEARLPVSLSYGMTETAAMVAALRPEEFLGGGRTCGTALPHARLGLTPEGEVRVAGRSVFLGYHAAGGKCTPPVAAGGRADGREFTTGDLGRIDESGRLQILGRRDALIITGGKKVDPNEVEAVLRESGEFSDVAVLGVPDAEWGEAVVAFYPADQGAPDLTRVAELCAALSGFKRPRRFLPVPDWPRNAQGKLNRAALLVAIRVDRRQ